MKKVTSFQKLNIVVLRLVFYQCGKFQIICQLGYDIIQFQSSSLIHGLLWKYRGKTHNTQDAILSKRLQRIKKLQVIQQIYRRMFIRNLNAIDNADSEYCGKT